MSAISKDFYNRVRDGIDERRARKRPTNYCQCYTETRRCAPGRRRRRRAIAEGRISNEHSTPRRGLSIPALPVESRFAKASRYSDGQRPSLVRPSRFGSRPGVAGRAKPGADAATRRRPEEAGRGIYPRNAEPENGGKRSRPDTGRPGPRRDVLAIKIPAPHLGNGPSLGNHRPRALPGEDTGGPSPGSRGGGRLLVRLIGAGESGGLAT